MERRGGERLGCSVVSVGPLRAPQAARGWPTFQICLHMGGGRRQPDFNYPLPVSHLKEGRDGQKEAILLETAEGVPHPHPAA